MSMNLIFRVKGGVGIVDFPFQTSTVLTHAVLAKETNEERLALIEEQLREWDEDHVGIEETLGKIRNLMESPYLELDMM